MAVTPTETHCPMSQCPNDWYPIPHPTYRADTWSNGTEKQEVSNVQINTNGHKNKKPQGALTATTKRINTCDMVPLLCTFAVPLTLNAIVLATYMHTSISTLFYIVGWCTHTKARRPEIPKANI